MTDNYDAREALTPEQFLARVRWAAVTGQAISELCALTDEQMMAFCDAFKKFHCTDGDGE